MKKLFCASALLLFGATNVHAETRNMISRGGLGFLFADHNSFQNPGNFAMDKGGAFQAEYGQLKNANTMVATPSFVYGGKMIGFGVYGERQATTISNSDGVDTVGAGAGVGLMKERLTLGAYASRQVSSNNPSDGTVGGTLTWNGLKRVGFAMGGAFDSQINSKSGSNVTSARGALGYGLNQFTSVEAVGQLPNTNNTNAWNVSGLINFTGKMFFFSGGANYDKGTTNTTVLSKLGLAHGRFDAAAEISYTIVSGGEVFYGATARLQF